MQRQLGQEERTWAMLCHLAAFSGFVIPLGHVLGPLVMWLLKRQDSAFVDDQGKQALNFQLSISLYGLAIIVVIAFVAFEAMLGFGAPMQVVGPRVVVFALGALGMLALGLFAFVAVIVAAVQATNGERFRYPLSISFFR